MTPNKISKDIGSLSCQSVEPVTTGARVLAPCVPEMR